MSEGWGCIECGSIHCKETADALRAEIESPCADGCAMLKVKQERDSLRSALERIVFQTERTPFLTDGVIQQCRDALKQCIASQARDSSDG